MQVAFFCFGGALLSPVFGKQTKCPLRVLSLDVKIKFLSLITEHQQQQQQTQPEPLSGYIYVYDHAFFEPYFIT